MTRYTVTLAENVRRYETIIVETTADLETMLDNAGDEVPESVLTVLGEGDVVSSDYGPADESDYAVTIEEVVTADSGRDFPVPYPPTTAEIAEAWVRWAETEIGVGWHPDTKGADLTTFRPIGTEALCQCGETFNPADFDDYIHLIRNDGEECGLKGVIVNQWGQETPLLPDPDVCQRYDDGLEAAHRLLPDIYATAMSILSELHPDLFEKGPRP